MLTKPVANPEAQRSWKTFLAWCRRQYWLALLPVLPILLARFYYPDFLDNEAGKLIAARRMLEPAFLSNDWLQTASGEDVLYSAFSAMVAALWLVLKNSILVVLAGRLLLWAFVLYALLRLARALEIERYSLAAGLAIWVFRSQSLGAGEWIFGGIEGKCVAYAMLFLAMESALRNRVVAAAVYCGFAIWFHVLVGGWGAMALGGALLLGSRNYGWRRPLQFCAINGAFLLPLVWTFLRSSNGAPSAAGSAQANRLIVLFRNPHHLDPYFFHGSSEFALACILVSITTFGLYRQTVRSRAALIRSFLLILLLQFGAGLIARGMGQFWFLKAYPFRVADVLVGLLFWLTLPMLLVRLSQQSIAARCLARLRPLAWCALLFFLAAVLLIKSAPMMKRHFAIFAESWAGYIRHNQSPLQEATQWIRQHTPPSSVILAPPWEGAFWMEAERAEVVNYKRAPHTRAIVEWQQRMMALNGGSFHSVGEGALQELQQNYPELDAARVEELARTYGADYFLTTRPRADLAGKLVHENGSYFVYQLHPAP
jgi:hypothetical protein